MARMAAHLSNQDLLLYTVARYNAVVRGCVLAALVGSGVSVQRDRWAKEGQASAEITFQEGYCTVLYWQPWLAPEFQFRETTRPVLLRMPLYCTVLAALVGSGVSVQRDRRASAAKKAAVLYWQPWLAPEFQFRETAGPVLLRRPLYCTVLAALVGSGVSVQRDHWASAAKKAAVLYCTGSPGCLWSFSSERPPGQCCQEGRCTVLAALVGSGPPPISMDLHCQEGCKY